MPLEPKINCRASVKSSFYSATILDWAVYDGTLLSRTKCKHLHACRKHNCNTIVSERMQIQNATSIIIHQIHVNNRYRWKTLWKKKTINIIKCKATVVAKADYVLPIYGFFAKSNTKFPLLWTRTRWITNKLDDSQARTATNQPLAIIENLNTQCILEYIKKERYKKYLTNITKTSTWYQNHLNRYFFNFKNLWISRRDKIKITRLRLGHTQITHKHNLDQTQQTTCPFWKDNL